MLETVSVRQEELFCRDYDQVFGPLWTEPLSNFLFADVNQPLTGQILDAFCRTGGTTRKLLEMSDPAARIIAVDPLERMLSLAREKLAGQNRIFFSAQKADAGLPFDERVFDATFDCAGAWPGPQVFVRLSELCRVTKPSGFVRAVFPIRGSFEEFFDVLGEVLLKHEHVSASEHLRKHIEETYPEKAQCEEWANAAGQNLTFDFVRHKLLFSSAREFFFSRFIESGPLPFWQALVGSGETMQDVFWYAKETIDTYFTGRAFDVSVVFGRLECRAA